KTTLGHVRTVLDREDPCALPRTSGSRDQPPPSGTCPAAMQMNPSRGGVQSPPSGGTQMQLSGSLPLWPLNDAPRLAPFAPMGAVCPPPNPKVVMRASLTHMVSSRNVSLSSFTLSLSGPVVAHWNVPIVPAVHLAMQPTDTLLASAGATVG